MWLFGDSYDHYTDLTTKYGSVGTETTIGLGTGRFGTNCLQFTSGNAFVQKALVPGSSTAGAFITMSQLFIPTLSSAFGFAAIRDGITGYGHLLFIRGTDGSISVWRWTSAVSTSPVGSNIFMAFIGATDPGLLGISRYDCIELYGLIHGSAGAVQVKVNGNLKLNKSGINTLNSAASSTWSQWALGLEESIGTVRIDDTMMYDDYNNGDGRHVFIGDRNGEYVIVLTDGNTTQMTRSTGSSNASCVNMNPPDGSKYVSDQTVGHKDMYVPAPLTRIVSDIVCVQAVITAEKTTAGTRAIAGVIRSGGTDYVGADNYLPSSYTIVVDPRPQDPNTSADWADPAAVNAIEVGQKITV